MWAQQQYWDTIPSQHPQRQTLHPGIMDPATQRVNTRVSRNRSEKQRRDNINIQIATMADSLPMVHTSPKKMDKISILRIAASYLRANYTIGPGKKNFLPSQLEHFDVEQWILDRFGDGSMFLAISTTGKIIYISKNVEQLLGYPQSELFGHNIQSFVPAEDHEVLMRNLTPDEMLSSNNLRITDGSMENSNSSEDSASVAGHRRPFKEQRRCFEFRIAQRPNSRREHNTQYERFTVTGKLRKADFCENNGSQMRHRDSTSNDIFFIGIASIIAKRPITELSLMDAKLKEYITRHLVDGRIIFCDHRISIVAGYLSEEVSGKSAFNFMHKEDFHWTIVGLRQMYVRGEGYGWSCYRLRAKNGDYIYLKTYGYLEYDKNTQSVESFVCVNKQLTKEEGEEGIREMKARFSATVSGNSSPMTEDEDIDIGSDSQRSNSMTSFEDPPLKKVEDAITYLVSDLPSSLKKIKSPPVQAEQYETAATISQNLPPASEQASKLGITGINCYPVLGEDKHNVRSPQQDCSVKKEPNIPDKVIGSPSSIVQQPQNTFTNIGNNEIIKEVNNVTTSNSSNHRCEQHRTFKRDKPPSNQSEITNASNNHLHRHSPSINSNHIDKCSDISPNNIRVMNEMTEYPSSSSTVLRNVNVIRSTSCQVKLEPKNVLVGYTDNCTNDLIISSDTVSSQSELSQQHTLKRRTCNDEDCRNMPNKKKQQANFRYLTDHMNDSMVGKGTLVEELTEPNVSLINLTANYNQVEPSSLHEEESELVTQSTRLSNKEDGMRYMLKTSNFENRLIAHPDSQSLQIENDKIELPLLNNGLNNDGSSTVYFMNTPENLNDLQTRLSMQQAFDERIFKIHGEIEYSVAVYESTLKQIAPNISEVQSKKYNQIQADCKTLKQDLITLQQDHHNNMQHQG